MRCLLALVLGLAAISAAGAQPRIANALSSPVPLAATAALATPDTTSPWRYVPLHVGNVWEYQYGAYAYQTFIEKDTLISGRRYVKEGTRDIRSNGTTSRPYDYRYLRFDTTGAYLLEWYRFPEGRRDIRYPECPFNAPFDSLALCGQADDPFPRQVDVRGRYDGVLVFGEGPGRGLDTVRTAVKEYPTYSVVRYAADVGMVYWETESPTVALYYYRVNGVEHGRSRLAVASEPVPRPEPPGVVVEVGPNPVRDRAWVRVQGAGGETVRVTLVDVTGRSVGEWHVPTTERVEMDGRAWSPGVYLLRACSAHLGCASTRLVKLSS